MCVCSVLQVTTNVCLKTPSIPTVDHSLIMFRPLMNLGTKLSIHMESFNGLVTGSFSFYSV